MFGGFGKKLYLCSRNQGHEKRAFRPPLTPPDSGGERSGMWRPDVDRHVESNTMKKKGLNYESEI